MSYDQYTVSSSVYSTTSWQHFLANYFRSNYWADHHVVSQIKSNRRETFDSFLVRGRGLNENRRQNVKKRTMHNGVGLQLALRSRSRFSNDHTDRFDITVIPCVFLTPVTSRNIKYINSTYPHTSSCSHHYVYDFHCPPYWDTNDATSVTACGCFTT